MAEMDVSAIRSSEPTVAISPQPSRVVPATPTATALPAASSNLSEAAKPVYQALQAATTIPPSADPTFVPPSGGNALRLYAAVQAIAAERVYPAPVFSFSA
jgi:hypothetical protein